MQAGSADRLWFIVNRWQQYESERRANIIRVIGIIIFYSVELANYHGISLGSFEWPKLDGVTQDFHLRMTIISVAWVAISLAVLICLRRRMFPRWLIYATVMADLLLLTLVLLTADGPASPLVVGYFLILALAATRFSLPLIRVATAMAGLCYLFLLGAAKWAGFGVPVPRHEQAIVLLGLILSGLILGQVVRRTRVAAEEYKRRREKSERERSDSSGHGKEVAS